MNEWILAYWHPIRAFHFRCRFILGGTSDISPWRIPSTREEQNSYNNNQHQAYEHEDDKKYIKSGDGDDRKEVNDENNSQKGLPLVDTFMRSRNPHTSRGEMEKQKNYILNESENIVPNNASSNNTIPMMRSKDSVNQYLKSTATIAKQLNSIEENSTSGLREDISSVDTTSGVIRNTMLRTQPSGQSTSPSTPAEGTDVNDMVETEKAKIDGVGIRRKTSSSPMISTHNKKEMVSAYPDLGFLENDVGLWDAFFLHGKNSRSHR